MQFFLHIFPQGETAYVRVKEDYGGGDSGTAGRRSRTRWAIRRGHRRGPIRIRTRKIPDPDPQH